VLFVCPSDAEPEVRARIRAALATGALDGPHGATSWVLRSDEVSQVRPEEQAHCARLAGG
jgi:hypothetical protein